MASIDALTEVSRKPSFNLNDNEFISLKSVKEVATLEDQPWKELVQTVHSFIEENIDKCKVTPRSIKKECYSTLVDTFFEEGGSHFWDADRKGYQRASHLVWPDDEEK